MVNINQNYEKKKLAIVECIKDYNLIENENLTEEVISFEKFPNKSSKKLAFLILAYKKEVTVDDLKRISDQPAGLVMGLRRDGFIFQDNGNRSPHYHFKNNGGKVCRKIIGFKSKIVEIKRKAKAIIEKSVAACVSAIEIYNKPDFQYREETFSILLVNAWELLFKAKILNDNNGNSSSIHAFDNNGKIKTNRSGNPLTIDIYYSINRLVQEKKLDNTCRNNIELLIEIRDNAIHFINKGIDFTKKVQEIGTASLKNYITAINEWFGRDLSQYNFYLMPMSFFHPIDFESFSIHSKDKEIKRMLEYFRKVESSYPYDENSLYSITLQIKTKFIKTTDVPAIEVRYTNKEDAPEIRVTEEDVIKSKYPLSYKMLMEKLNNRYNDFKRGKRFYGIKKDLENTERNGEKFCRVHYANVLEKKGTNQKFYSPEIIKEFDKHFTKK